VQDPVIFILLFEAAHTGLVCKTASNAVTGGHPSFDITLMYNADGFPGNCYFNAE